MYDFIACSWYQITTSPVSVLKKTQKSPEIAHAEKMSSNSSFAARSPSEQVKKETGEKENGDEQGEEGKRVGGE